VSEPLAPHSDLTLAALIRELQMANQRADEAERFVRNFIALAPFARPDELPPLSRHVRPSLRPRSTPRPTPPQGVPQIRHRAALDSIEQRSTQWGRRWAPPPSIPHRRSPGDGE
jgi:hypothetical protein